jgi:Tfp pilus assembly protein PilZ
MAERTTQDTRRYRRQTLRVLVDYRTETGICCDYATTLGAGGMFLETDEPLIPGSIIKARFRLPNGDELHEIEGRVVWHRPPAAAGKPIQIGGAGVKFTDQGAISKLARELEDYDL